MRGAHGQTVHPDRLAALLRDRGLTVGAVYVYFVGGVPAGVGARHVGLPRSAVYFHYEAFAAVVIVKLLDWLHLTRAIGPIHKGDKDILLEHAATRLFPWNLNLS